MIRREKGHKKMKIRKKKVIRMRKREPQLTLRIAREKENTRGKGRIGNKIGAEECRE